MDVSSLTRRVTDTMERLSEVDVFLTSVSNTVKSQDSILKRLCDMDYGYAIEEKKDETPD